MEKFFIECRAWDVRAKTMIPNALRATETHALLTTTLNLTDPFAHFDGVKWMPFTGMLDRKKKKIFMGDIVKYAENEKICPICAAKENKSELKYGISKFCPDCGTKVVDSDFITIAEVVFQKGGFAYMHNVTEEHYQSWPTFSAEMYLKWVEVVGNIYETPELLTDEHRNSINKSQVSS